MRYHFAFICRTVESDHRDIGLVSHFHRVAHRVGVGRVDQQQLGAANRQVLHVSQLFRRVVLGIQHHQVIAQLVRFFLRAVFQRHEERVVQGRDNQRDSVFRHRVGTYGGAQRNSGNQCSQLFHIHVDMSC